MRRFKKKGYLFLIVAAAIVLATATGLVGAKYMRRSQIKAQIHAADFHVSADYLEYIDDTKPETTVTGWSENGIWVELYTYEKTNVALINADDMDIKFTVTVEDDKGGSLSNNAWEVTYYDADNTATAIAGGETPTVTTLASDGTKDVYRFNLKYVGDDAPTYVDFKVNISEPYAFPLTGGFILTGKTDIDWTVVDKGDYEEMTIKANDYSGTVTVSWPTGSAKCVVPDNTNDLMTDWVNSAGSGSFTIGSHETVTLLFGEKKLENYSENDFTVSTVFTATGGNS